MKKEYNFLKMQAKKNPYASKKKAVGINLSAEVIDYFKKLAKESNIPYQTLIDLYLRDCVKNKKKPKFDWAA
jgi:predicted DNA binding CopG/RHH family protein